MFGFVSVLMGVLFLMVEIPKNKDWRHLRKNRTLLAVAYILVGSINLVFCGTRTDTSDGLSGAVALYVSYSQSLLFTTTCLQFLKPHTNLNKWFGLQFLILTIINSIMLASHWVCPVLFFPLFLFCMALYTFQLLYYVYVFRRNYRETVRLVEYEYDDDIRCRLKRIAQCFYFALAIGIVAWFMVLKSDSNLFYCLSILLYVFFYTWMFGFFVTYVNRYGFMVRAVSSQEKGVSPNSVSTESEVCGLLRTETSGGAVESGMASDEWFALKEGLERWVESHKYCEAELMVDDITTELRTTRSKLYRYLMKEYNMNFRQWRNRLRLEEAKRLLRETETPPAEVYAAVGFSDRSNFHRLFRDTVGVTPLQYKKTGEPAQ